jgi:hypothetical protein
MNVAPVEDAGGSPGGGPRPREHVGHAAAHAEAEHGQATHARVFQAAQVRNGGVDIHEDLLVAQASHARGHVRPVLRLAVIQVRRRRDIAVAGEILDAVFHETVETGSVLDDHDAGRRSAAGGSVEVDAHRLPFDLDGVPASHEYLLALGQGAL